ncbi:hypothetical protein PIB30_040500 [Stylosanthes scabra]|uniref:Uncharacterized protein n=1 Tax=Stylosanthes scabra TaxID=79078 RepID=A0ABU6QEX9_9FABA|nr:hypothetical protein [Stylosanthes scabra]
MIMLDDRTDESKSFSVARVLIDSFQWEQIHEWVSINVDDRMIEVFVKEVGAEVYSVESHPDRGDTVSETMEDINSLAVDGGLPVEVETIPATDNSANLNWNNFVDPLIEVIINGSLDCVHQFNYGREKNGGEMGNDENKLQFDEECSVIRGREEEGYGSMGVDPTNSSGPQKELVNGPIDTTASTSDGSCPYPPGFGPCLDHAHIHHEFGRARLCPQIDSVKSVEGEKRAAVLAMNTLSEGEKSGRTVSTARGEDSHNDETLYKINQEAFRRALEDEAFSAEGDSISPVCYVKTILFQDDGRNVKMMSALLRPLLLVTGVVVSDREADQGDSGHGEHRVVTENDDQQLGLWEELSNEGCDDGNSSDVEVARELWSSGGLSFVSSDEEEIV